MKVADPRYSLGTATRALSEAPDAQVVDLVSIAAQLYAADRSRHRGREWIRRMDVCLPISSRGLWVHVGPVLEQALSVLTDDQWRLEFAEGRPTLAEEQQAWLSFARGQQIDEVALFSGGLDSFAGAARWLAGRSTGRIGLLSLRSSTVVGKIQRDLASALGELYPDRVVHLPVPVNLIRAPDVERSQRTRGFLYSAVAVAVASWSGAHRVLIFENGYGSLNPRLVEHQMGAQATKSTHPHVVQQLQQVFDAAGFAVSIDLPYRGYTKSELVAGIPDDLKPFIAWTVSCDGFPLRDKRAKQCGRCGSCILRQQALRSAGLAEFDRLDYRQPAFECATPPDHLLLMAFQAWELVSRAASEHYETVTAKWPEIGLGIGSPPSLEAAERLAVLRRYGLEWASLIAADRELARRLGWSG